MGKYASHTIMAIKFHSRKKIEFQRYLAILFTKKSGKDVKKDLKIKFAEDLPPIGENYPSCARTCAVCHTYLHFTLSFKYKAFFIIS